MQEKANTEIQTQDPAKSVSEEDSSQLDSKKVSFFSLYRFAEAKEIILVIFGIFTAMGMGTCAPLIGVIFGGAIGDFDSNNLPEETLDKVAKQSLMMIYLGFFVFGFSAISEASWITAGERLGVKVRTLYLESVLKKSVTWFDLNSPQELPTKISSAVSKYQAGIGEKVGKVIMSLAMLFVGLVVAFVYGWQLALVLIGITPLTMTAARLIGLANSKGMETSKKGYAKCGGYAEEAITAIKTVHAFCTEAYEKTKYLKELANAQAASIKNSMILGAAIGLINLTMSLSHGLGYFIGSFFIQYEIYNYYHKEDYNCAHVMTVFFSSLFATMSLGMMAPHLKAIGEAQMAAYDIYEVLDSVSMKIVETKSNKTISDFKGRIVFDDVTFAYPADPSVKILKNFSTVIEAGTIVGICGQTGSGKSTIIQLIEGFYKPNKGKITVDGVDINDLDLGWWRGLVGYVGQEPVLFNTTISENIKYGKENATQQEVEAAASDANAAEFIELQPLKYETITGSEGGKISGGQKQRIAIARALIKKPKVLLLDEATSALDNVSERRVQDALDKLQKEQGITVIVIAHRLSTIKSADKIIVLKEGELKEEGTDSELRLKQGAYADLCNLQSDNNAEEDETSVKARRKSSVGRKGSVHEEEAKEEKKLTPEEEQMKKKIMEETASRYSSELWSENLKHKFPLIFAIVLSAMAGFYMPTIGVLFGMVSIDLLEPDKDELRRLVNLDFIGFVCAGVAIFLVTLGMFWMFGYVASKVTYRLRERLYNHVLSMDIGWFDLPVNVPSALNNVLSEGTENINGVVRMIAGTLIQSLSALVVAIAIGFGFSWKMTLIVLGCVPIMGLSGFIQTKFQMGFATENEQLYKNSVKILSESVKNFRTVASFTGESRVVRMYSESLQAPLAQSQYAAIMSGLLFGCGQILPYLIYAAVFYFAALFQEKYGDHPRSTFIAVYALVFSAAAIGQIQQYAPDLGKAYAGLFSVYGTLDTPPGITSPAEPTKNEIKGEIEFVNVTFKYPAGKEPVLKGFSVTIKAGEKVAIVGTSGSGKSTIIQLLERFYDVTSGQILIDGVDIKNYSLADLRRAIGYVPQEPVLFDTTIEENIKYGNQEATQEQIMEACQVANALDFIIKKDKNEIELGINTEKVLDTEKDLKKEEVIDIGKGFERRVGAKGSFVSGGEKQRLAIARAVLKKPKIVLFDEATSALDNKVELLVQEGLNRVLMGRTSIVVAHRLTTIKDNDTIIVLKDGVKAGSGTKQELLQTNIVFQSLYGNTGSIKMQHSLN